jgi:hypothetical protein
MRRTFLVFLIPVLLLGFACRPERSHDVPSGEAGTAALDSAAPALSIDRALDDRFAFAAGLPAESPSYASWQEDVSWKDFAGLTGRAWAEFDAAVLQPMRVWAADELGEAREYSSDLFCPFGGPDFAPTYALFPAATKTVLIGLEPVGNLPDFGRASADWRHSFFADMKTLVSDFFMHGYFITMHMNDVYSRGKVDGALPVIGFFLKRGKCSIVDVRRLTLDDRGGFKETSYERLAKRPRRPYGVRIDYLKPGDTVSRSVYYFSCDVENKAFQEGSPLFRFFEGLGNMTTLVKSGSYLLHWSNFSTLRNLILDRSLFVLQDDTAVPYRFFKSRGWEVRLFGRYATPVKDFTNVEQQDLREAYEAPKGNVKPLPFHFGYRWRTRADNLLLAKRPRRPYKFPAIK